MSSSVSKSTLVEPFSTVLSINRTLIAIQWTLIIHFLKRLHAVPSNQMQGWYTEKYRILVWVKGTQKYEQICLNSIRSLQIQTNKRNRTQLNRQHLKISRKYKTLININKLQLQWILCNSYHRYQKIWWYRKTYIGVRSEPRSNKNCDTIWNYNDIARFRPIVCYITKSSKYTNYVSILSNWKRKIVHGIYIGITAEE